MTTKAFLAGQRDGASAVADLRHERANEDDRGVTAEEVRGWFASGQLSPDESLINALDERELAQDLGVPVAAVRDRAPEFDAALEQYNAGYRTGALEAV